MSGQTVTRQYAKDLPRCWEIILLFFQPFRDVLPQIGNRKRNIFIFIFFQDDQVIRRAREKSRSAGPDMVGCVIVDSREREEQAGPCKTKMSRSIATIQGCAEFFRLYEILFLEATIFISFFFPARNTLPLRRNGRKQLEHRRSWWDRGEPRWRAFHCAPCVRVYVHKDGPGPCR